MSRAFSNTRRCWRIAAQRNRCVTLPSTQPCVRHNFKRFGQTFATSSVKVPPTSTQRCRLMGSGCSVTFHCRTSQVRQLVMLGFRLSGVLESLRTTLDKEGTKNSHFSSCKLRFFPFLFLGRLSVGDQK